MCTVAEKDVLFELINDAIASIRRQNKDDDESIKDKRFLYKLREHYYATDETKIDYETEADTINLYRKKYTTWFIQKKTAQSQGNITI